MFVVAIYGWREETPEMVQALAGALGIIAFEARQRMIGGGPSVVASFADQQQAREVAEKVGRVGIKALIVDATAARLQRCFFIVRRFKFEDHALKIEDHNGQQESVTSGETEGRAHIRGRGLVDPPAADQDVEQAREGQNRVQAQAARGKLLAAALLPVHQDSDVGDLQTLPRRAGRSPRACCRPS